MDTTSPSLENLVALWPVACNLSQHLPVGDLITLARLSSALRALLHGFDGPGAADPLDESHRVRASLRIGEHGTPYWQRLKDQAPFLCSSPTHTKGPAPKACRYCSKPICEACIVRSSFARGHENTFQNRIRHLCKGCWESGNPSQAQRFPLSPLKVPALKRKWYDPEGSTKDYCTCTLKEDGWLCLDCKDLQNWEAISSAEISCHGEDCNEPLDEDKARRRICLWCDKALPRQIGGTTRYHWNQKMIEARARNAASRQADLEEYNRKRQKLMRMSRREMRGDDAVKDDPDADLPQFVRHLDTINYRSYMSESAAPSGDLVYDSKRGYWRYNMDFLLRMKGRCGHVAAPPQTRNPQQQRDGGLRFARTNAEKADDFFSLMASIPSMPEERATEWCNFKAVILELLLVQKNSYHTAQQIMQGEYGFDATVEEYHTILQVWYSQDQIREYRRNSLETEGEDAKSRGTLPKESQGPGKRMLNNDLVILSRSRQPGDSTSGSSTAQEPEDSDTGPDSFDDTETRLARKIQQDREYQAPQMPSAPPSLPGMITPLAVPSTAARTDATTSTDDESSQTSTIFANSAAVLEEDDEDPPPYTTEDWTWPGHEQQ